MLGSATPFACFFTAPGWTIGDASRLASRGNQG
jgi:hypothetical protein